MHTHNRKMVLRNAHYEQGTIFGGYKQAILPLDWSRTQFWHRLMSQTSFLQRLLHAAVNTPLAGFPQVYALAVQLPRIVVTYNAKDFRRLAHNSKETGVIGVPALMLYHHIDNKLTSLLTHSTPNALLGKYTALHEAA